MKHIPVIFQHQKCNAPGTEVSFLKEAFSGEKKNPHTQPLKLQQLGSK